MAKAVFACENVEKFSSTETAGSLALPFAVVARFMEQLFMGYGPSHAGNWYGEQEQRDDLRNHGHLGFDAHTGQQVFG